METPKLSNIRLSIQKLLARVNWRSWLPSRGTVVFTLVVALALFWAQSVNALPWMGSPAASSTSTGTWPYQGRLADSLGNPITDTTPMVFRLYSSSEGGVPLWEENWTGPNSVQISDGLFNVMLGSLIPIPQSIISNNGSLWLGITAGADDEMTPRVQLGSVPFAVQALTVPDGSITTEKLAEHSVMQANLGNDISLIPPDGSITSAKIADGTVATVDLANGAVTQQILGSDVNLIQIQSGSLNRGQSLPAWVSAGMTTSTAGGDYYYVEHVTFAQSFTVVPTISVSISKMDVSNSYGTRVDVYAQNITTTGFDMVFHKWSTTVWYEGTASWIAYGNQ